MPSLQANYTRILYFLQRVGRWFFHGASGLWEKVCSYMLHNLLTVMNGYSVLHRNLGTQKRLFWFVPVAAGFE